MSSFDVNIEQIAKVVTDATIKENMIETNEIYLERLEDFKKVLIFNQVTKIKKLFRSNLKLFYSVPTLWRAFKSYSLKSDKINPFEVISKLNKFGLTRDQVKAIFGKTPNSKTFDIPYSKLIEEDNQILKLSHGIQAFGDCKRGMTNKYILVSDLIEPIFNDKELLEKVCDATSEFYTARQRRLIFSQILNKKQAKQKTNE